MSQYPYQGPPGQPGYPGYPNYFPGQPTGADLLGPSRRAGVLMFVVGALLALGGLCFTGIFMFVPIDQMLAQSNMTLPPEVTPGMIRGIYVALGVVMLLAGILYIVLGVFVRNGGRGATITAIVFTILGLLVSLCNTGGAFIQATQGGGGQMMLGAALGLIPLLLLIWLTVWLFQANAAAGQHQALQASYLGQYYGQQQQQGYGQPQPGAWPQQQQWPQPGQQQQPWNQPPQQQQPPPPNQQQWPPPPQNPT